MRTVPRIDPLLSDMWFNHEHPEFDKWNADRAAKMDRGRDPLEAMQDYYGPECREALVKDAAEFIACYTPIVPVLEGASPEDLADDFIRRL